MGYKFQLVFQFPEDFPLTRLDLEDDIAEAIGDSRDEQRVPHLIDGNSYGSGTIEFWILTDDPHAAFELAKPLLASKGLLDMATVGVRGFTEDDYKVIWPVGFIGTLSV